MSSIIPAAAAVRIISSSSDLGTTKTTRFRRENASVWRAKGCPLQKKSSVFRARKREERANEEDNNNTDLFSMTSSSSLPSSSLSSIDEVIQEHSGSIEDAFTSETKFKQYSFEREEREDRKRATNLRRSSSFFYVVSSVLFVFRNEICEIVQANANRNEFLIVFDAIYTFICLCFFAHNVAEKERISANKSSRSALLFGDAAVVAAANFVIAAATMDIEQIDEVLIESAPRSKVLMYALPSIALVAFQVGLELFHDDSAEKKATEETIVRAEDIESTKGVDNRLLGIKKITVKLSTLVPNWITVGKIASRSVRPLQVAGAILVNINLLERAMLAISTGRSDAFVLFHGSWTKDLSSIGSYAFVLASVMVFIQTSAEIQIERAKKLFVDEFESIESLAEVNRDP
jgi:hypothetical protein